MAFAPLLFALHQSGSLERHLIVLALLLATMVLAVCKIVTEEIHWAIAPLFGLPIGLSYFVAVATAAAAHRRIGTRAGIYTFAATVAVLGWVQYSFTGGASWGALAHTQADNLHLVQLTALTGVGGLTFLVALGSALLAAAASVGFRAVRVDLLVFAGVLGAALLYGQVRLANPAPGATIRVGGVVSPVTFRDFRAARQDVDSLRRHDAALFARTERAADLGAKAVVWNEVATMVSPAGEAALARRGQALAMQKRVLLLMAYGVVTSTEPLALVNKYGLYLPDGTLADEYLKRYPVPGDGDKQGTAHARVVAFGGTSLTGAICYDFSYPQVARDNARDGAGLVLVPSSDWRGIDPLHGRMARMNAVAAGVSMFRPVRGATSIASDPYGRLLGSLRADSAGEEVMVAAVPGGRVPTLYARTGELVPLASLAFCLLVLLRLLLSGRRLKLGGR